MIDYKYIQKDWIVSDRARRCYRATATGSVVFVFLVAVVSKGYLPAFLAPLAPLLLLTGALCMGATVVSMECFIFLFDNQSPAYKQVFWFFMMLVPCGAAIFCFRVYSKSSAFDSVEQHASLGASA